MECRNNYCIYEDSGRCILNAIIIDEVGMCANCIYPEFEGEALVAAKKKTLLQLQEM